MAFTDSILVRLGLDNSAFNRGLEGANHGVKRMQMAFKAFAGIAVVGTFKRLVDESRQLADNLGTLSSATGVSVELIQTLQIATTKAGGSVEGADKSILKFAKAVGDANGGMAEMKKQFDALGVQLVDKQGKTRDVESVLLDTADAFARMNDKSRQVSIGMKLFGESGAAVVVAMSQGADEIKRLRNELEALNVILTGQTIAEIDRLDKMMKGAADRGLRYFTERLGSATMYLRTLALMVKNLGFRGFLAANVSLPFGGLKVYMEEFEKASNAILNQANAELELAEARKKQGQAIADTAAKQKELVASLEKESQLSARLIELEAARHQSRREAFRMKTIEDVAALAGRSDIHTQAQRQGILAQRIMDAEKRMQEMFLRGDVRGAEAMQTRITNARRFLTIGQEGVRDPEAQVRKQIEVAIQQLKELQTVNRQLAQSMAYDGMADSVVGASPASKGRGDMPTQ